MIPLPTSPVQPLFDLLTKNKLEKYGVKTTPNQVERVAELHVRLYTTRVERAKAGSQGFNLAECEKYLRIWKSIVAKKGSNLNEEEVGEIVDAFESGDYDDIFGEQN